MAVEIGGQVAGGQREIDPGQRVDQRLEGVEMLAHGIGQTAQELLLLRTDGAVDRLDPVVAADRFDRLEIDVATAHGRAATHALDRIGDVLAQHQHGTLIVPFDLFGVLELLGDVALLHPLAHRPGHLFDRGALLAVQFGQLGGGVLAQLTARQQALVQALHHGRGRAKAVGAPGIEGGPLLDVRAQGLGRLHDPADVVEGARGERRPATAGLAKRRTDIGQLVQGRRLARVDRLAGGIHRCLHAPGLREIGRRLQGPGGIGAVGRASELVQKTADTVEFEGLEIAYHGCSIVDSRSMLAKPSGRNPIRAHRHQSAYT